MKRVAIVAPHFPPSNLASVHRSRLWAMHLREFGWDPTIVTVDHHFYEEKLDWDLVDLVPRWLRIERVSALPTRPVRVVGDVGIRGFAPLLARIVALHRESPLDFVHVPIPSNYAAPIGRLAKLATGVPYGIDYIDPWVHDWPGSNARFSKAWFSRRAADLLEPWSVGDASLITGVAEGYYAAVRERNPGLDGRCVFAAMPYGGEAEDHVVARRLARKPYLFEKQKGIVNLIYAGAMLPRGYPVLERLFAVLAASPQLHESLRLHFVGTGKSPDDPRGYNVRPVAEKYGLFGTVVHEHPSRIPYLDVLTHLEGSDGVLIVGSTEAHYTPSKVYQGILAQKPVFAILHEASTACAVVKSARAGVAVPFAGEAGLDGLEARIARGLAEYLSFRATFDPAAVDASALDAYSARETSRRLAVALDAALELPR